MRLVVSSVPRERLLSGTFSPGGESIGLFFDLLMHRIAMPILRPVRHALRIAATASVFALAFAGAAHAQSVTVSAPWVRATAAEQKATGAFMQLKSATPVRLVEVRSAVAGVVELHEMAMEGDMMRMRAVSGLDLPAGKAVDLKPGGYHVMLMDLKQPIKAGDTVPLTLVIETADKRRSTVEVKALAQAMGAAKPMGGQHMP
jgi:periplasmic copper chaperone A